MRRVKLILAVLTGAGAWAGAPGCVLGPTALEVSRVRYSQVIQQTTSEQLLLNLVRLQYRESPLFLDVGSVSAQFQFRESADISGTIKQGPNPINPDRLGLDVGVGYERRESELAVPFPLEQAELSDLVQADSLGYSIRASEDGQRLVLTKAKPMLVWRIPPAARESAEVAEIVQLLGLPPGRSVYEIQTTIAGQPDPSAAPGERTQINISTRSLVGTLFYLSQAVEVPAAHRQQGAMTTTRQPDGELFDWTLMIGDLLRVRSQRTPPIHPAVAVQHRGYWYYIDDADLSSKSTFGFLSQLFALQAGAIESVATVLTLPVGG